MQLADLDYQYPEKLIATEPSGDFRAMLCQHGKYSEIDKSALLDMFNEGDVLLVNNTKVSPRRVFTEDGLEVLFVKDLGNGKWQVLFPSRNTKVGEQLALPGGLSMKLLEKGIPQIVQLNIAADESYFFDFGQLALPPYIQKARGERQNRIDDRQWYQTAWAKQLGSTAAPTASLHFSNEDLQSLRDKGVFVEELTLHVGLGTFLPVRTEDLREHQMHQEYCEVNSSTVKRVKAVRSVGRKVWALGTTATRAIEACFAGHLEETDDKYFGETDLFITPGFKFQAVDALLTNFHQPKSTLLALVAAFAGLDNVKESYQWAINNNFRLFSYGDLSVWQ